MTREAHSAEPHSAFILTDARDGWWNDDFVGLMAARLALADVHRVLDVGAGHGHWGHLWARHFASDARLLGVDREQQWVVAATERSARLGLSDRFTYRVGSTEQLPVADHSFDMVTCQTVLMHVTDPAKAISEMTRALEPGGLLLLAEPNNMASILTLDSVQQQLSTDVLVGLVRFHLTCNRGRIQRGEGDYAIGARLPQLLTDQGLVDIRVHLNDHASTVCANGPDDVARLRALDEKVENIERRAWLWSIDEARRLYLAGGGATAAFDLDYAAFMDEAAAFVSAVRAGTYSTAGGAQHCMISARRAL